MSFYGPYMSILWKNRLIKGPCGGQAWRSMENDRRRESFSEDQYEAVDRMLKWLDTATDEEKLAMLRRAGIINEENQLTKDYGGPGDPPKCKRKLPF